MAEYSAQILWTEQDSERFIYSQDSRGHERRFDGGNIIQTSSSPYIVPLPFSVAANIAHKRHNRPFSIIPPNAMQQMRQLAERISVNAFQEVEERTQPTSKL